MTAPTGDPFVGRTIAHYDILARVGGGGMGVVYRARDTRLGRVVALKFLPPQWSHDEGARLRFVREAQSASATNHPSICTVHDIETTDDGQLFIVMAYYEGPTLKQRLENGPLPIEEALDISTQVADGLAKAHAQGVVHRDVKPGNVILTEEGARIVDFGLATFADALKLTVEHSTLGTAAYMAPEQVRGESADARSDVWAVGVMLYEMIAGHVPFQGSHAEAIAYAIRHETPAPLRTARPDVGEDVEQLVFRALHKDKGVRYQNGRELARALRQVRGHSLPLDLRTAPVPLPEVPPHRRWGQKRRPGLVVAATMMLVAIVGWIYLFVVPVERVPVAITSVVNLTGYSSLDSYLFALMEELNAGLRDSRTLDLVPSERIRLILHRFRRGGPDSASRTALEAIGTHSGSRLLVVPTLVHENGTWRGRAEVRDARTATNEAVLWTPPVVSSLPNETAYALIRQLALEIDDYLGRTGSPRLRTAEFLRRLVDGRPQVGVPRMATLDAAAAFEEGLSLQEETEYSAARRAFAKATALDPRNPIPWAWHSRVALLSRQDEEARASAEEALRLITDHTQRSDALFVQAVAAEARRDFVTSEARYRELIEHHPSGRSFLELAGFLDRRNRGSEAIAMNHRALTVDNRLVRVHLDLCRLYNPSELASARNHAELARQAYREVGFAPGEAQALFCLVDVLRRGRDEERRQARGYAEEAFEILRQPGYEYNLARAYNYLALAVGDQRRFGEAASLWEKSLQAARSVGNRALESLVLMNLGVAHEALGHARKAREYSQQSADLFQSLGQEQRAAEQQANAGALRIEYGDDPDEGLRQVQNALAVSNKLGNSNFEVLAAQLTAVYHRNAGEQDEAERELSRAINLAKERNLDRQLIPLTVDLARTRFERGDYAGALDMLTRAVTDSAAPDAHIWLARVQLRVGDFEAARNSLNQAARAIDDSGETGLLPVLHLARGELAYESGRLEEASTSFASASSLWVDDLPNAASVEARAHYGWLEALRGRSLLGITLAEESLARARRMGRFGLEARCRLILARILVRQRNFQRALDTLDQIQPDSESRSIDPELRALVHYWRGQALMAGRDRATPQQGKDVAAQILRELARHIPEAHRTAYASRPDIRAIIE